MTPENIIERVIVRQIVRDALRLGYTVNVNDGEEDAIVRSSDETAIMAACFSTDEDIISIRDGAGFNKGFVHLVYGNGTSVISDYSDVPAAIGWLTDAEGLADAIEEGRVELAPVGWPPKV